MKYEEHPIAARHPVVRWAYFVLGWVLVATGIVGLILPVMPGTVFLILAAACFTRSSPRFEAWLVHHPRWGSGVRAWRAYGAIPPRAKGIAIGMMIVSIVVLAVTDTPLWLTLVIAATLAIVAAWIKTRPDGPPPDVF